VLDYIDVSVRIIAKSKGFSCFRTKLKRISPAMYAQHNQCVRLYREALAGGSGSPGTINVKTVRMTAPSIALILLAFTAGQKCGQVLTRIADSTGVVLWRIPGNATASCTGWGHNAKEANRYIPHSSKREGYGGQCNGIRNLESPADPTQCSNNTESYLFPDKARDHR